MLTQAEAEALTAELARLCKEAGLIQAKLAAWDIQKQKLRAAELVSGKC
jgi:hypothetical protein